MAAIGSMLATVGSTAASALPAAGSALGAAGTAAASALPYVQQGANLLGAAHGLLGPQGSLTKGDLGSAATQIGTLAGGFQGAPEAPAPAPTGSLTPEGLELRPPQSIYDVISGMGY